MRYSPVFLDHFLEGCHAGSLSGESVYCMKHHAKQLFSTVELYLSIKDNMIVMAKFHASTTPALIAAAEYVCRWAEGKTLSMCHALTVEQVLSALCLTTVHSHMVRIVVRLLLDTIKLAT